MAPAKLYFTDDDEANAFIAKDPFKGGFADDWPRLGLAAIERGHGVLY